MPEQSPEDGLLVSAYMDSQNERIVYVLTNLSNHPMHVCAGRDKQVKTYTTNTERNLGLSIQSLGNLRIPERSVVTVVNDR